MKAIQITQYGGPEVLLYQDISIPKPSSGEALIRVKAVGVNFIDVYHRTGRYPGKLPFSPGMEAAGIVEAVGAGVTEVKPGDRVAYAMQLGGYAEYTLIPATKLVVIPSEVDFKSAAAIMLQGMTAHYLSYSTYPIQSGDTVLIHAGAGGVGLLLTQIARNLGATVITTVSTEEKAELSRKAGAHEVILYEKQDFETEVKRITQGKGVQAVYDSVGKTTFDKGLNCLMPRGYMVLFGASSGPAPQIDPLILSGKGSIFLTRPTLGHYMLTREELLARANQVLGWVADGSLQLQIEHVYPLAEAKQAHIDLESRKTTGKLLLLPD
ncbi:quinone oxidoreductase [Rhodocytophaga rosea]|uniref:Quinone oxidoreductase n=1 Tax=Rhodocytophaga rosea TaxID=2704465 RepID=A0A6C0GJ28_9BACT|nr:quinone oxidoreductase [Rhodocytophaga rosea]QHT68036.1 quinone oxidoreductase [Rhodocytophaga rosea]